jgi:diguanylate cyclase (GGDEF)-like protein/PAS domain S-box-containing protein
MALETTLSHISPVSAGPSAIDAAGIVARYQGVAMLVDAAGRVLACNGAAEGVRDVMANDLEPALSLTIARAARESLAQACRLKLHQNGEDRIYDLSFLPLHLPAGLPAILVLGRDNTFDTNLNNALLSSRQLFKDLVDCSSDFAWETNSQGRFTFVSPKGALGFAATDLNGYEGRALIHGAITDDTPVPFDSRVPLNDAELWLKTADGSHACIRTSCRPVFDEHGNWCGARGVCRDISEFKDREFALAQARDRENLTRSVIDAIRDATDPDAMLQVAAESIAAAVKAGHVWIMRSDKDGAEFVAASCMGKGEHLLSPPNENGFPRNSDFAGMTDDGRAMIIALCNHGQQIKGRLCVSWSAGVQPPVEVAELVHGVADQIGIVITQWEQQEELRYLSNTDELTKLPNRRAFTGAVERRLRHHQRYGRAGALLYVDLDNFKPVNDTHGHERGDAALRELAEILTDKSRATDIAGRLGGDEFAVWLEETTPRGACQVAERLLERSAVLSDFSGAPDKPLGVSIGIAVSDPDHEETVSDMLSRADAAMYVAKNKGKGQLVLAPPASGARRVV